MNEIFLGLAFTCGSEEFVIPFFDRGLPVEYELMRSIRVVSRAKRRRSAFSTRRRKFFGGFDFQTKRQNRNGRSSPNCASSTKWRRCPPDADYPADLDVLLAALPHR